MKNKIKTSQCIDFIKKNLDAIDKSQLNQIKGGNTKVSHDTAMAIIRKIG